MDVEPKKNGNVVRFKDLVDGVWCTGYRKGNEVCLMHYAVSVDWWADCSARDYLCEIVGLKPTRATQGCYGHRQATREALEKEAREVKAKGGIAFPWYLYEHGGTAISEQPYSDPWDSGLGGYVFVPAEKITDETITKETARKVASAELREFADCMGGWVYHAVRGEVQECSLGHIHFTKSEKGWMRFVGEDERDCGMFEEMEIGEGKELHEGWKEVHEEDWV